MLRPTRPPGGSPPPETGRSCGGSVMPRTFFLHVDPALKSEGDLHHRYGVPWTLNAGGLRFGSVQYKPPDDLLRETIRPYPIVLQMGRVWLSNGELPFSQWSGTKRHVPIRIPRRPPIRRIPRKSGARAAFFRGHGACCRSRAPAAAAAGARDQRGPCPVEAPGPGERPEPATSGTCRAVVKGISPLELA